MTAVRARLPSASTVSSQHICVEEIFLVLSGNTSTEHGLKSSTLQMRL